MKFQLGSVTRVGNRKKNEDSYGSFSNSHTLVMVVADGMGGHGGGQLASQSVIKTVGKFFEEQNQGEPIKDPVAFLQKVILASHDEINRVGAAQNPPVDPRTTIVICLIQDSFAWWAHLGDSRLYLFRHGTLKFRTRDHSRIEELMQQGLINAKEAQTHPQRHQVTRCLGGPRAITKMTITKAQPLQTGDMILLCSDGLWNPMRSQKILDVVMTSSNSGNFMDDIASDLASEAESAAMPRSDNVTLMLMRWMGGPPTKSPQAPTAATEQEQPVSVVKEADGPKDEVREAVDTLKSIFEEYEKELK